MTDKAQGVGDVLRWLSYLQGLLQKFQNGPSHQTLGPLLDALEGYRVAACHGMVVPKMPQRSPSQVSTKGEWWSLQLSSAFRDHLERPSKEKLQAFADISQQLIDATKGIALSCFRNKL